MVVLCEPRPPSKTPSNGIVYPIGLTRIVTEGVQLYVSVFSLSNKPGYLTSRSKFASQFEHDPKKLIVSPILPVTDPDTTIAINGDIISVIRERDTSRRVRRSEEPIQRFEVYNVVEARHIYRRALRFLGNRLDHPLAVRHRCIAGFKIH